MQETNMGIVMNSFQFHEPGKPDFWGTFLTEGAPSARLVDMDFAGDMPVYSRATPVLRAASATALATAGPTRRSNAMGMI